jgi:GNAT superfamily N-acetyltransferase
VVPGRFSEEIDRGIVMTAGDTADQDASVEVRMLPASAASALVAEITGLVNRVYATAEEGLWSDDACRTTVAEMAGLVRAGQIAVARLNGTVVGTVRVQRLDCAVGEFGMLVAEPAHRGLGIGRRLVGFAEQASRERGLSTMQLELLVPRTWTHPGKQSLHDWYTRIGYQPVRKGTIDEQYPALAPLLTTPCDFVTYQKPLG